jgi:hypothetical protein
MSNNKAVCEITVNKNRRKKYKGQDGRHVVYMDDKQEFQLEFYNPTFKPVMAKIKFNGEYISTRGIVIRPGERVYLDRYIDEARKFIFETYTVGKSKSVEKAIAKNGLIDIDFFKEEEIKISTTGGLTWTTYNWPYGTGTSGDWTIGDTFTTSNTNNLQKTNISTNTDGISSNLMDYSASAALPNMSTSTFSRGIINKVNFSRKLKSTKSMKSTKETGRVGKGGYSNQDFKMVDNTFNTWSDYTIKFHIIPTSEEPITREKINKVRRYCSQCGSKVKPGDKFCNQCGAKL